MTRYGLILQYDGTAYHGWQFQPGLPTVQGCMEETLERILGGQVRVIASGRTDSGVHARGQVAHFDADWSHGSAALKRALNALLPEDVSVGLLAQVSPDFHARFSALAKTYCYYIFNNPFRSALVRLYSWHVPFELDVDAMNEAAGTILGAHDFAAFGSPTDGTESTVRQMVEAYWTRDEGSRTLVFTVRGTGFLRYMVRRLVGTMVPVGRGKITPERFRSILESCDLSQAGPSAPPQGLFLEHVDYPSHLWLAQTEQGDP